MSECKQSVYLAEKSIDMIDAVNMGYNKGRTDGAREFAEWLLKHPLLNGFDEDYFYTIRDCQMTIDEVLAEWQKGEEK